MSPSRSSTVPSVRVRLGNDAPLKPEGDFVLYWMTAFRRTSHNFALQRAVDWCEELGKPLLVLEPLRAGYRWACDRFHRFVLDGMRDNARALARTPAGYYPYVEPRPDDGKGLVAALAARAAVVVADDFPEFFLPRAVAAGARQSPVSMELVDSNGLVPLRAPGRVFLTARSFRLWLQRNLPALLSELPRANPMARRSVPPFRAIPAEISRRWPAAARDLLQGRRGLESFPIDHAIAPALEGGSRAGSGVLAGFLADRLPRYVVERNEPSAEATSGLSPYLHFGHVSTHQVLDALAIRERWSPGSLDRSPRGGARGGWGMSEAAEAFLDELVTWRELGFNFCALRDDYADYESLPAWARATLEKHAADQRPGILSIDRLAQARTPDPLWNAAQNQLVREGRIHNYLRMLWGKRVLEWTPSPREAVAALIELNNRFALDGRDPNSYSGIFWVLGRYDRPWGPERPIFGTVRYMSSKATERKLDVRAYLQRFGPGDA